MHSPCLTSCTPAQDAYDEDGYEDDGDEDEPLRFNVREDEAERTRDYVPPEWWSRLKDLYVAICYDRPDEPECNTFEDLRRPNMLNHLVWCRRSTRIEGSRARVLFTRPLLNDRMTKTIGSIIGIAAEGRADAEELMTSEPYAAAGLFGDSGATLYAWPMNDHLELSYELKPYPHAVVAYHRQNIADLRAETRPKHLDYLISLENVAGAAPLIPLLPASSKNKDTRGPAVGSLIFLNAPSVDAAEETMLSDPYYTAGIVERMKVYRFCEIDVTADSTKPRMYDPVRDALELEGLSVPSDYPELTDEGAGLFDDDDLEDLPDAEEGLSFRTEALIGMDPGQSDIPPYMHMVLEFAHNIVYTHCARTGVSYDA